MKYEDEVKKLELRKGINGSRAPRQSRKEEEGDDVSKILRLSVLPRCCIN